MYTCGRVIKSIILPMNARNISGLEVPSIMQRHDQNGTFCPLQNPVHDATGQ
jgi:hypothetical protein